MSQRLRCAIYTRKSSEEGLEQNFNSLHAQREACEAYILSQAGEGWALVATAYDDGGCSGGNIDRPGLKQLLDDIGRGFIDVVVVYKVDRLTRSLSDFAKIVDLFDAKGVSFVSVTQAFNTTTSMGRLTLNVLLSFAQFEREVTGERIRDKIAASKAKGLRMGGRPPLGYDIVDGRLSLNPTEADRVRYAFTRYLELGCVQALEREKIAAKIWVNRKGMTCGGGVLGRGALYYLLRNVAYRGVTRHKDKLYEDTHPAIVDQRLWEAVQAQLAASNGRQPKGERRSEKAALAGKVFDDRGHAMVQVHTRRGATRYRYYVSRPKVTGKGEAGSVHRIATGMLEQFLVRRLEPMIAASWHPTEQSLVRVAAAITRVALSDDRIVAHVEAAALNAGAAALDVSPFGERLRALQIPFHMRRRQGALILQSTHTERQPQARPDRALIRAVVLARQWAERLERGEVASVKALAKEQGLCQHYTARLLPLAYLAPDLVDSILAGAQPRAVSLAALTAEPLPPEWTEQRRRLARVG
jgi:site-specific DNA recombinase